MIVIFHLLLFLLTSDEHYYYYYFLKDNPSPPKNVKIADFDADFVDLEWKKPDKDGGSPITSYVIEKRDRYKYVKKTLRILYLLKGSSLFK